MALTVHQVSAATPEMPARATGHVENLPVLRCYTWEGRGVCKGDAGCAQINQLAGTVARRALDAIAFVVSARCLQGPTQRRWGPSIRSFRWHRPGAVPGGASPGVYRDDAGCL